MSRIKDFLAEVSVRLGYDGEINDDVLEVAQDLLHPEVTPDDNPPERTRPAPEVYNEPIL